MKDAAFFPIPLLAFAWWMAVHTGADSVGSSLLAVLAYFAGLICVFVGLGRYFRERRRQPISTKWMWLFLLYAGLYAAPWVVSIWQFYFRERVEVRYSLEWRIPKEWNASAARYEVSDILGGKSGKITSSESQGSLLTSNVSGHGLRHAIRVFPGLQAKAEGYTFLIRFPKEVRVGDQSAWLSPTHRGESRTDWEFIIGKDRGEGTVTDTNGVQLRYTVTAVDRHKGS